MKSLPLYLKNKEDRHLKQGHLWVYSNQIDVVRSPLKQYKPGELIHVLNHQGDFLGTGYINPHTLLCARILSQNPNEEITTDFFIRRIKQALTFRERVFVAPYYRLVYGEGDGLPGLIIDRFGDHYVCEVNTAGMENLTPLWMEALIAVLKPAGILLKNNKGSRVLEQLPCYQEIKYGDIPEHVVVTENHMKFHVNLLESQKTGWYYDQRDNRARLSRYCRDQSVLDVYSYTGSFGMYAASYFAKQVTCIDSSEPSCRLIKENAILNACADRVSVIESDAVLAMKQLLEKGQRFDVVLIDPPAFIKRRKDIKAGLTKYFQVNALAAKLVNEGGILMTSSCSMHLLREDLLTILKNIALQQKRQLQILEHGYQGIDHPISPFIPETEYLTTIVARLI